jgi:hypothetical protein
MSLGSFMDSFLAVGFMERVQRLIQLVALLKVSFGGLGALPCLVYLVPANGGIVTVQQGK